MANDFGAARLDKACRLIFTAVHEAEAAQLTLVPTAVEMFSQLFDSGDRPTDQSVGDAGRRAGFSPAEAKTLSIVWLSVLSLRSYQDGLLVRPLNPSLL